MKTAAEELQLKVKSIDNVDARGQDASGKQVVIGAAAAELVQAAFATRESSESDLLETQKGEDFVVRTDRVTPARVPALSEVEAKVTQAWQVEERRKLSDAKAKEAFDKVSAGGDLAAIAKDLNVQVETSKAVTRYDTDPAAHLTQPAAQAAFRLPVGKIELVRVGDGNVIVRPKSIEAADMEKAKDTLDRFGTQLDAMLANDLVAELLGGLRQKYGVTVDQAVFAQAFSPQQQQQQ
jgi:peptidyl-prolyl cis-trans isomerase D